MYEEFLPSYMGNAAYDAGEWLAQAVAGTLALSDALEFSRTFRIRAIGSLLLRGTPDSFWLDLSRSGRAFLHFLEVHPPSDQVASRAAPFFDAIASGDVACARATAQRTRTTRNADREYEEDFLYVRFLMQHFFMDVPAQEGERLLERYAALLDGGWEPRFGVAVALAERDPYGFDAALRALLLAEADRFTEQTNAGMLPREIAATEANVSIEGLALLRLAEQQGLETQEDYARVPSIVRGPAPAAFPADAWRTG